MKVNEALKYAKACDRGDGDGYVIDAIKALAAEVKRLRAPRPMSEAPRVWVGKQVQQMPFWWWDECQNWLLDDVEGQLLPGTIFVPGNGPKPVADPASMPELQTCSVVDWLPASGGEGSSNEAGRL